MFFHYLRYLILILLGIYTNDRGKFMAGIIITRRFEATLIEMHRRYDKLRARLDKRGAGDLSRVNS